MYAVFSYLLLPLLTESATFSFLLQEGVVAMCNTSDQMPLELDTL